MLKWLSNVTYVINIWVDSFFFKYLEDMGKVIHHQCSLKVELRKFKIWISETCITFTIINKTACIKSNMLLFLRLFKNHTGTKLKR